MIQIGQLKDNWYTEFHKGYYGISLRIKETLLRQETPYQLLEVFETDGFGRLMVLDGAIMVTDRDEFIYHEMLVHVPLCAHPEPRHVLIIGGGDGGTAREALKHPSVERVDLVEIDEAVIQASRKFFPALSVGLESPKTRLFCEDGIEFVKRKDHDYDVILVDSTDPVGPAVGLFEDPFYIAVRNALREGGFVSVQSESPFFDGDLLASVHAKLTGIFGGRAHLYVAPIVTYPGGFWSFTCAGTKCGPLEPGYDARFRDRELETRYYTPEVHHACFQLPRYVRDLLQ